MKLGKLLITVLCTILLASCAKPTLKESYDDNVTMMRSGIKEAAAGNRAIQVQAKEVELPGVVASQMDPAGKSGLSEDDQDNRFDISVHDVEAALFFSGLAKDGDDSIVVSPDVEGTVSLDLKGVTVEEALNAVREVYGYRYDKMPYGYNIYPKELETRVFVINKLNIKRSGESEITLNPSSLTTEELETPDKSTASVLTEFEDTFWGDLQSTIEAILNQDEDDEGEGGEAPSVYVNPTTGVVVVKAYLKQLRSVERYLDETQNITTREVIIEAEILDVELKRQYSTGIDWRALEASGSSGSTLAESSGLIGNIFTLNLSTDGDNFTYAISMLASQGKVSVLSSPRVAALNNENAIIKIGTDEYFVTNVETSLTTGGSDINETSDIDMKPFFSGIALDVTPQITESGEINMHIHPIISRVEEDDKQITVDDKYSELPLAKTTTRELDTVVKAKNKQVIILGGLMQNNVAINQSNLPLDDDYSVIVNATADKNNLGSKNELVILLKATIVERDTWANELNTVGTYGYDHRTFLIGSDKTDTGVF